MAPKMLPKRYQKSIKKMIGFLIDFWRPGGPRTGSGNERVERKKVGVGPPPPSPKLLAKAKSDNNELISELVSPRT